MTEMVTGIDLIESMIEISMGMALPFTQDDIRLAGHAIECRINAEIPEKNFRPSPGKITHIHLPGGNGVRVDTAIYDGYVVPPDYDSMIAKVIVHGKDRESAIRKMLTALDEMVILGISTNINFQYLIFKNPVFCEGKAHTGFIDTLLNYTE